MPVFYNGKEVVPGNGYATHTISNELLYISKQIADKGFGHGRYRGHIRFHRHGKHPYHIYDMPGHPGLLVLEDDYGGIIRTMLTPNEVIAWVETLRPNGKKGWWY